VAGDDWQERQTVENWRSLRQAAAMLINSIAWKLLQADRLCRAALPGPLSHNPFHATLSVKFPDVCV
jgi:hypothetical protein